MKTSNRSSFIKALAGLIVIFTGIMALLLIATVLTVLAFHETANSESGINRAQVCNNSSMDIVISIRVVNTGNVVPQTLPKGTCSNESSDVDGIWSYCTPGSGQEGCPPNDNTDTHKRVFKIPGNFRIFVPAQYKIEDRDSSSVIIENNGYTFMLSGQYGWTYPFPENWEIPSTGINYVTYDSGVTIDCYPCTLNKDLPSPIDYPIPPIPETLTIP